jgi:hypothetical protein
LRPHLVITRAPYEDIGGGEVNVPSHLDQVCVIDELDPLPVAVFYSEISSQGDRYKVNVQTGPDNAFVSDRVYRFCVRVGGADPDAGGIDLGYRDVRPQDGPPTGPSRTVASSPVLPIENGSNLSVEFRIEHGALCNNDDDCGEGAALPGQGGTIVTNTRFASVEVGENIVSGDANIIIERVECPTTDGRVTYLPIDLPQVPGCYDVRTAEGDVVFANPGALVGVCIDRTWARNIGLTEAQIELLQLHHERSQDGVVEALPNAYAAHVDCGDFTEMASARNALVQFARRTWRGVQRNMSPWFSPPPAFASHRGFGGYCSTCESPLAWALPAQFEIWGGTQDGTGFVGHERDPRPLVRVTDGGDPLATPPVPPQPVQGATVFFDITLPVPPASPQGSLDYTGVNTATVPGLTGTRVVTDEDGIASVGWQLGVNPNQMRAIGVGIGCRSSDGCTFVTAPFAHPDDDPPLVTGPFAEHFATAPPGGRRIDLGVSALTFTGSAIGFEVTQQPHDAVRWKAPGDPDTNFGPVTVCTVPETVGVVITLVAYNNNGTPAQLIEDDEGPAIDFVSHETSALDPTPGCWTFETIGVTKTGAYRLDVNDGSATSEKFNIRPHN